MAIVGFIGTGNMGGALARAAAKSGLAEELLLANRSPEKALRLAGELGGRQVDNQEAAARSDVLFLGVKPQMLDTLLGQIGDTLKDRNERQLIVSMMAGKDLQTLQRLLGEDKPILRIMPNIPVCVGAGVTLYCGSGAVTEEDKDFFCRLMAASGLVEELDEHLMEAASGVTGCGPAFAAMFVEALADGAVACGLPRKQAIAYAAQMLAGSARMLLASGEHPGVLKDRVCSPAGSTIQGVRKLEERAFRAAVTDAVIATWEKEF
ncbi:MAG: pyrroline-5-carboxylate reductase [Oscillospiraceae bacterium]|nr:pyrroline-5-carboxylate reductase [Oscillospiraceae bacterium]